MQTIIRATRHERLCKAIRTHGWRRRDRIEIVAGILKECLVGQTYTELVYLMRIGAAQITDYLNWMHSSGLLEKEIRNMCPRGLARRARVKNEINYLSQIFCNRPLLFWQGFLGLCLEFLGEAVGLLHRPLHAEQLIPLVGFLSN